MNIGIANRIACALICVYSIGERHYAKGLGIYLYLTNWGAILTLLTMLSGLYLNSYFSLRRRLVSLSWCATFTLTVLFWGYLYNFNLLDEPIGLRGIFTHGGFLPFLTIEYIYLGSTPSAACKTDIFYFATIYIGCVLVPFGVSGHPIYPGTSFDKPVSFILPAAAYLLLFIGFLLLKQIKSKSVNAFLVKSHD